MEGSDSAKILGIIPAYNEEEKIGGVVSAACEHLPVLVIDDGSQDETGQIAESSGAKVFRQNPNQGKGLALRAGFLHAIEAGYRAVVTLDADGQHDPDEIPTFLRAFKETHADLIIGERDFSQIPPIRRMANTLGKWSFSWAVGQPIGDNQSGYRLISTRMMKAVLGSRETGFEFEVEMIVICIQRGYRLEWVPIRTIYGGEGSHIQPLKHTIEFTRMVLQTRRKMREF
ncbi:MAG: glycosyltransferase family 2 protein [Chloroflexota bacterium]|nr:MAG: glycosyltransferase family 2 protein [Chloroflexota bacterium]